MRATLAAALLLYAAPSLGAQSALPTSGPSGFRWTGAQEAVTWADSVQSLQMWTLHAGHDVQWTPLDVPPSLLALKAKNKPQDEPPSVVVTFDFGKLHLFWTEQRQCDNPDAPDKCLLVIHQAERDGRGWQLHESSLQTYMVDSIWQVVMADATHGWMLLAGDPGAGQLPQEIATTNDGGKTWKAAKAEGAPIGLNRPELLMPRSAVEAWMAAANYFDDGPPLVMAHTVDGGTTWSSVAGFSAKLPGCPDCTSPTLSQSDNAFHPGNACFEVVLDRESKKANEGVIGETQMRYCLAPDGKSWKEPVVLRPAVPFRASSGDRIGSDLPIFADRLLGFEGSSKGIFFTKDGGNSWDESAPLQAASNFGKDLSPGFAAASGEKVLLLLKSSDGSGGTLMYSSDHGATWIATTPAR